MESIDRKFIIKAENPCSGKVYTDKEGIFFCAHDLAVPAMLERYKTECTLMGCGNEHLESIDLLIDRVIEYQRNINAKIPDTDTDCEIDRCIGGIDVRN